MAISTTLKAAHTKWKAAKAAYAEACESWTGRDIERTERELKEAEAALLAIETPKQRSRSRDGEGS